MATYSEQSRLPKATKMCKLFVLFLFIFATFTYIANYLNSVNFIGFESMPQSVSEMPIADGNFSFENEKIANARKCLVRELDRLIAHPNKNATENWKSLGHLPRLCSHSLFEKLPVFVPAPQHYENKYFVRPRSESACSIITFGIGHDTTNEESLQREFAQCNFLGFDPDAEINEDLFREKLNGHFVKATIGGRNGTANIMRLDSKDRYDVTKAVRSPAHELLELYHGRSRYVDLLNIDIEGFEYEVLEAMLTEPAYRHVCQFNVEFHHPDTYPTGLSVAEVFRLLRRFVDAGTFLWIKSDILFDVYFPSFFVNLQNRKCYEKFLKTRWNFDLH